jgi:hypothetical protein
LTFDDHSYTNTNGFCFASVSIPADVDKYEEIPFSVLQLLTSMVNYGGRITDDKDMRTSDIIVASLLCEATTRSGYAFSKSGLYGTVSSQSNEKKQGEGRAIRHCFFNLNNFTLFLFLFLGVLTRPSFIMIIFYPELLF